MKLRELVHQVTGNSALDEYLKNFPELDYELAVITRSLRISTDSIVNISRVIRVDNTKSVCIEVKQK